MPITTLVIEERCDGCEWPDICTKDRTCWKQEKQQPWERTRLDLGTRVNVIWTREKLIEWVQAFVQEHERPPHHADLQGRSDSAKPTYQTIQVHGFENLADLVRHAGHEPHRRRRARSAW